MTDLEKKLLSYDYAVGPRDPAVLPGIPGAWMVTDPIDNEDGYIIVGDDREELIIEACDHLLGHLTVKPYTVLLLRPDYIANNYGEDTYMDHVNAESGEQAQNLAQRRAWDFDFPPAADMGDEFEDIGDVSFEDYAVLMVIEGHRNDIKSL